MTFNLLRAYAKFLSRLLLNAKMYLKYILDSFSEFNGYHVIRRVFVYFSVILPPVDL